MEMGGLQMRIKEQTFKDKAFYVLKGLVHPEYSFYTFETEEREFRDAHWDVKEGDVVFDVGASYGTYTLSALSMGAKVFSFEPEATIFCDLANNVYINDWNDRCFLAPHGLWSSRTTIDMKQYAPHWAPQTISADYNVTTLDDVVETNSVQKIDWMKIDVEGAEVEVLKGGMKTLERFHPRLIIECHDFLDATLSSRVKEMLLSVGYTDLEVVERPPCLMVLARYRGDEELLSEIEALKGKL